MRPTSLTFIATSVCIVICAAAAPAAAQPGLFGIKGGLSGATISAPSELDTSGGNQNLGFVGGIMVLQGTSKMGGWQIEGLVHQKGARNLLRQDDRLRLTYLEIPVLLHADFLQAKRRAAFLTFGPSIAFNLNASYEDDGIKEDIGDDIRKFDVGFNVGTGVELGPIIVEARYTWGFRNLFTDGDVEGTFKNRGFAVTAGLWLGR